MPFYVRKSVALGPLRFNLSNAGVGVSAGVRGFRFGSGPRGNYVHLGRAGVYYRATLDEGPSATPPPPPIDDRSGLTQIESGDVARMTHSSAAGLLEEINRKYARMRRWPLTLAAGLVLSLATAVAAGPAWGVIVAVAVAAAVASWATYQRDLLNKTTVILYDIDEEAAPPLSALHQAHQALAGTGGVWHLAAAGATSDWKRNAGAGVLVRRAPIRPHLQPPLWIRTNVDVPAIPVGRQTLHFFPDQVLVIDGRRAGSVDYGSLAVAVEARRFIEEGTVPADASVVDWTWRYPNKSGGPDRRFKDNRQLPVALYAQLHLASATGLNEVIQISAVNVAEYVVACLRALAASSAASR